MTTKNFTYDDFIKYVGVSRETFSRLEEYVGLLKKWQTKINLIGPATVMEVWLRHIIDSAQLLPSIKTNEVIIDVGSGAGLPGLILAILGIKNITLVESDSRKVAFLKEAARITKADVSIQQVRAESIDIKDFSLITARAFASIKDITQVFDDTLNSNHKMLLHKGKKYEAEIKQAQEKWSFDYTTSPSITDSEGVILFLHNFKKRGSV